MTAPADSAPEIHRWPQPGELWSLWDMLNLRAEAFVSILEKMTDLDRRAAGLSAVILKEAPDGYVPDDFAELMRAAADTMETYCTTMDLPTTLHLVGDIRSAHDVHALSAALAQFRRTHRAELSGIILLKMDQDHSSYYREAFPFGPEIAKQFPLADKEIVEASKCFALERYTASAFHLMRALEIAIRALARCLAIPDPTKPSERNWGDALKTIKAEVDRRWPTAALRMAGDGNFFEALYASLDAMKNPYRNATMHVDQWYDEQDARDMFAVVRAFMRKAASRFDEVGAPFA